MAGKNKRATFAEDVQSSTGGEIKRIRPSDIVADHSDNASRWNCYDAPDELRPYFGEAKICFTLEQIEERLRSHLAEGQIDLVDVAISGTGKPTLVKGFLRHCAFLLAEVRGQLDSIPGAKGMQFAGIKAQVVSTPKTQADYAALARRNLAENRTRQDMSPVDLAFYIKRRLDSYDDNGVTPTRAQIAAEMEVSQRFIDRKMALLGYRPQVLLAVHRGEMRETQAHAQASAKGEGNARGANGGIGRKAIRRRKPDARPKASLSPEQVDALLDALVGDKLPTDISDKTVREWIAYADAPPEPKTTTVDADGNKISPQGKKAPKKGGATAAA